jgi:hypothetical protein
MTNLLFIVEKSSTQHFLPEKLKLLTSYIISGVNLNVPLVSLQRKSTNNAKN